jgi:OOP family OmpA-OmpF porin
MWLYVDILKPATKKTVVVQLLPDKQTREADSLMQLKALMPKDLMIYFEFDKTKFKSDPQTDISIAEFKSWLDKYPESMLTVTGHTDFIGSPEYNQALGLERAQIVEKYLENKGIAVNKMITGSKGKEQPIDDNITHQGREKNRRTEITIKK